MLMRVLPLNGSLEPAFWQHVNQAFIDYYFFVVDWKRRREATRIWLALNQQDSIEGMMLVYADRMVQLKGTVEAARELLPRLDIKKADIQCSPTHKELILKWFKNVRKASYIFLMTLKKGEENLRITHEPVRLAVEDSEDIAALMRHGNPDWWGDATGEVVAQGMDRRLWFGIKINNKLVSVGGTTIEPMGSNIAPVVTHEEHRNKGYATSIVSALVKQVLTSSDLALIHVESANKPAVRVYTKVGFKPRKQYFLVKAEK
jgi:GNAT superfamily N-acetyltransferase